MIADMKTEKEGKNSLDWPRKVWIITFLKSYVITMIARIQPHRLDRNHIRSEALLLSVYYVNVSRFNV